MLQQTPVARVLPVHARWLDRWPTPGRPGRRAARRGGAGLGPARAIPAGRCGCTPRRAAIVERHGGEVPADHDDLLALPGVGDYTAAAVAVFAHGRRHAVLDTNVRRVLARVARRGRAPAARR